MSRFQFRFDCPDARAVFALGEFNGWSTTATPLRKQAEGGHWEANVDLQGRVDRHVYFVLFEPVQSQMIDGKKFCGMIIDPADARHRAEVVSL